MKKKLRITGTIIPDSYKEFYKAFEMDGTSPSSVTEFLPDTGEDVVVEINSYGGYLDAGNQMYTELMNYDGHVTVEVIMAGSAASVVAMAGDAINISPVGKMMIHNVSSQQYGDYRDMDKMSETLQQFNQSISNAYAKRTGIDKETILEMMDEETWFTAQDAVDYGFADSIMFEDEENVFVASYASLVPNEVIQKWNESQYESKNEYQPTMLEKLTKLMKKENE